ncbi:MAG TPA: glycine cleavage T C-terminal barrel domain-containing protein, partial [Polyangiales bacterium]|nr:glycine cleavage T C-terminal barrel domain-containing protein [Polyangiales bacterium]
MNDDSSRLDEARALAQSAGVRVRDELRVVRVRGDDRSSWLNGQVTGDVRALQPGIGVHALAINVRGKIMGELWVADRGEHIDLVLADAAQTAVLESFEHYIIMEDVVLEPEPDARIVSLQGPRAQELAAQLSGAFTADELGRGGVFLKAPTLDAALTLQRELEQAGARVISEAGFELARLRAAQPRFGVDYDLATYPQEAGLKHTVSFQKGCYLGQEVVCTLENRGRLNRRLCALEAWSESTPRAGDALEAQPGQAAGQLTSATRDPETGRWIALGYVKRAHAIAGTQLTSAAA